MATLKFVGRASELATLRWLHKKRTASLVIVKGRRRIGKSRLIAEFGKDYAFYRFSGLPPTDNTTKQSQLNECSNQLSLAFNLPPLQANDWNTLFLWLAKQTEQGKVIILLDEISWLGSKDPDFLGKLKNAWDLHFSKNPQLLLIICGSASAWINKNILSSTGFVGRVSYTLTLEELPLIDCNEFWQGRGNHWSAYNKFKVLAVTGGVPRYLEEIRIDVSAEENIRHLCFSSGGLLVHEFSKIFSDLFGKKHERYRQITQLLVQGSSDYTTICKKLGVEKSGFISECLNDLVMSGFVSRDHTWNPKTGISAPLLFKYRLKDNYLRFYLKYIAPKLPEIERHIYQLKTLSTLPGWASIMGLQFENLVLNNRQFIHKKLGLSAENILVENPFFQNKTSRQAGCQIDYMIQTHTNTLSICEIKFSRQALGPRVITEVKDKLARLSIPKHMSYSPVLIHVNGVTDAVLDANYFSEIIDFNEILSER